MIPALVFPNGRRVAGRPALVEPRSAVGLANLRSWMPDGRFLPWFVLPGIGSMLLLWPSRHSASAPTPPQDVFYAPVQSPEPPFSGPGAPPFS